MYKPLASYKNFITQTKGLDLYNLMLKRWEKSHVFLHKGLVAWTTSLFEFLPIYPLYPRQLTSNQYQAFLYQIENFPSPKPFLPYPFSLYLDAVAKGISNNKGINHAP